MVEQRKARHFRECAVDHAEEIRRDLGRRADPQLTLIAAQADQVLCGFNAEDRPFRSGCCECGSVGWLERNAVIRLLDIVDIRHAILFEIEEAPAIDFIAAARVAVRNHDRMQEDFLLRLKARLHRDHNRRHLRLDARDDFFLDDLDRFAGRREDQAEDYSFASYQLFPQAASTASGTASG